MGLGEVLQVLFKGCCPLKRVPRSIVIKNISNQPIFPALFLFFK
jgi:hypothetical protein